MAELMKSMAQTNAAAARALTNNLGPVQVIPTRPQRTPNTPEIPSTQPTTNSPSNDLKTPARPAFPSFPSPASASRTTAGPNPPAANIPAANTSSPEAPVPAGVEGTENTTPADMRRASEDVDLSEIIAGGVIHYEKAPLDQVLEYYSELLNRTILQPATLPAVEITLKSQTPLTRKEAIEAIDSVLALNDITTIPVGTKFIKIVPTANAMTEGAAFITNRVDQLPEAGQFITKVITLSNSLPSEVQQAISPLSKNPAGILPFDDSGVLVIRDFAINVKRMLELIEQIDVKVPRNVDLEVIPIKYALASDLANVLGGFTSGSVQTATASGGSGNSGGSTFNSGGSAFGNSNNRLGSSRSGNNSFNNTSSFNTGANNSFRRFSANTTAAAPPSTAARPASTDNANFANRLRQIVSRVRGGSGGGGEDDVPLLGAVQIIADERTNSLLIFGTSEEREMVRTIIEKLDVVQAQVLIEAVILEVSLSDGDSMGVTATHLKNFGNNFAGRGGINNGIDSITSTNSFPGNLPSGFSYLTELGSQWDVAIEALASQSEVKVLSRPRIQTSHAESASIFVGNTVPFVTGTIVSIQGTPQTQFQNQPVGISLNVLPLINSDGLVVMDIQQDIQQLGEDRIINGDAVPTTTERNASARVAVRDGDTIMLGGFISSTKRESDSGVPWLKDIPLLGNLFKSQSRNEQRVELIVLIRPKVLPTPDIAATAAMEEKDSLYGIRKADLEFQLADEAHREASQKAMDALREKRAKAQAADESRSRKAWNFRAGPR